MLKFIQRVKILDHNENKVTKFIPSLIRSTDFFIISYDIPLGSKSTVLGSIRQTIDIVPHTNLLVR